MNFSSLFLALTTEKSKSLPTNEMTFDIHSTLTQHVEGKGTGRVKGAMRHIGRVPADAGAGG